LKHDPDHPKAISFIVGVEARKEFVLCYSDDHKNSSTARKVQCEAKLRFGFCSIKSGFGRLEAGTNAKLTINGSGSIQPRGNPRFGSGNGQVKH
jgi:hypothetical protein